MDKKIQIEPIPDSIYNNLHKKVEDKDAATLVRKINIDGRTVDEFKEDVLRNDSLSKQDTTLIRNFVEKYYNANKKFVKAFLDEVINTSNLQIIMGRQMSEEFRALHTFLKERIENK